MENLIQLIRNITQIWVVTRRQCRISVLVSQASFGEETSGSVALILAVFSGQTTDSIKQFQYL